MCHGTDNNQKKKNVKPPEYFIFICSLDNFYYNFPGGISHCLLYFILVICFVEATNGLDSLSLIANFTFVARDSNTGKSALVNQVSPESEQEKILWEEAEERNKLRKMRRAERKKDFENEDSDRLNALLAEGRIFCDMPALADRDSILIRDTCLANSFICQPQQRNIHGRIFGGFFMQRAFDLAFSTTYAFAGVQPHFLEVDHVDFFKPGSTDHTLY